MSDLETLKTEIATLKNQISKNSEGVQVLMNQIDALTGELADARTISMQLRMNLISAQKAAKFFQEQTSILQKKIDASNQGKSPEVPSTPLKKVENVCL